MLKYFERTRQYGEMFKVDGMHIHDCYFGKSCMHLCLVILFQYANHLPRIDSL